MGCQLRYRGFLLDTTFVAHSAHSSLGSNLFAQKNGPARPGTPHRAVTSGTRIALAGTILFLINLPSPFAFWKTEINIESSVFNSFK